MAIREIEGQWEPEWEPLRGTVFGDLFSVISKEILDHALNGWSWPLAKALGLSPKEALIKIPRKFKQCYRRHKCSLYLEKECHPGANQMPWCFEPNEVEEESVRKAASKAIEEWRQGVYLIILSP